jgi:glycosyltransferase involved in cell wall biosynthesis
MASTLNYVLITPARNEAEFIEQQIYCVVAQTVRPLKWIIVSDGSTDGTDEIVSKHAAQNTWIELVRTPERRERHFAGKVQAFNAGYDRLSAVDYDVIVSLDADITFEPEYFSFLLGKLVEDPRLGLVGTPFKESDIPTYDYRYTNIEHVSGACQVFRRQCFEDIGGYVPVKGGCIDHIAVLTSRMRGWKTRTFTEKVCFHHRAMGTAQQSLLMARFKNGGKDYAIGNHPLWELFRGAYQMTKKPLILGGLMVVIGYGWSAIRRVPRPVSPELVVFQRGEQIERLKRIFSRKKAVSPKEVQGASNLV